MKRLMSLCLIALMTITLFATTGIAQQEQSALLAEVTHEARDGTRDATRDGLGDEARKERREKRHAKRKGDGRGGIMERLARVLPEEMREPAKQMLLEHRNSVYPLRQRIKAKEHELNALIATPEASEAAIQSTMDSLAALKAEKLKADVMMRRDFFLTTGFPLPGKPGNTGRPRR